MKEREGESVYLRTHDPGGYGVRFFNEKKKFGQCDFML